MTVWTPETCRAVSSASRVAYVSHVTVHRAADIDAVLAATRDELAAAFITDCRVLAGAEVHRGDVVFSVDLDVPEPADDGETPARLPGVRITARWSPAAPTDVEFRGGPSDGTVVALQRVPRTLEVSVPPPTWAGWHDAPPLATLAPQTFRYTITGWHEQARRWVYVPS